jgi:quinol monooxygenase YgiN
MICLNVILTAKNESDIEDIRSLLAQQGTLSRQEPGCLRFEVYHSNTDPKVFILNERWESQQALDVHRTAKAYTEIYQPKVLPKVDRVPHPATLVDSSTL